MGLMSLAHLEDNMQQFERHLITNEERKAKLVATIGDLMVEALRYELAALNSGANPAEDIAAADRISNMNWLSHNLVRAYEYSGWRISLEASFQAATASYQASL